MERNFKSDFERFLKESADQYKMYPSDKVWKGVNNSLHNRKKWYGLGLLLLLLTGGFITTLFVKGPKTDTVASQITPASIPSAETSNNDIKTKAVVRKITDISNYTPAVKSTSIIATDTKMPVAFQDNELQEKDQLNPVLTTVEGRNSTNMWTATARKNTESGNKSGFTAAPLDEYVPAGNDQSASTTSTDIKKERKQYNLLQSPLTAESVVNSFTRSKTGFSRKRGIEWQINFTPTISYRKLTANKEFLSTATAQTTPTNYAAIYNSLNDVKKAVTHKPDMGLELGLTAKYQVYKNVKVKAALQFNINRYDIKAFYHPYDVATIALNSGVRVDSLKTMAEYRNIGGSSQSHWLQNYYFQVSMPLGMEVTFGKNKNVRFGMAGTIQPTLLLSERAYLLSTDYKNYTEVSWLTRRWNANTAFETFVAYSTGKLNWQIGPQVRYQLKSSFISKYPVKENLFDFGLKVGITLNR